MALQDQECRVREIALLYINELGPEAKEAVPALIASFKEHTDLGERAAIARALGSIGPAAKPALPILIEFPEQPAGSDARTAVQEALRKISK
jgi:HEAT repeat protein